MLQINKTSVVFTTISFLIIALVCVFFINSTSSLLNLNIISYFWPVLFLIGIIFGTTILLKYKEQNLYNIIISLITICFCVASLGLYAFFLFLGKTLGD